jgi:hypothetical protein
VSDSSQLEACSDKVPMLFIILSTFALQANEKLEAQLLEAAGQVADAFSRMSTSHEDMERIRKEFYEAEVAHSNLVTENKRYRTPSPIFGCIPAIGTNMVQLITKTSLLDPSL